jgi:hypothetical protein
MDENPVNTTSTKTRNVGGAPFCSRNAWKHGLRYYKRLLSGDGLKKSTAIYHALAQKEAELIAALAGDPSPQERAIIADTIKHMLFAGSIDHYLLSLKSLVRKGRLHAVVGERTRIGAHIRENLKTLGLKRVVIQKSLEQILEEDEESP